MRTIGYFLIMTLLLVACQTKDKQKPDLQIVENSKELLSIIEEATGQLDAFGVDGTGDGLVFQPFMNPPEISSDDKHHRLATHLDIRFATNKVYNSSEKKNIDVYHRSYNGQLVGSTWRIKPGDSLLVDVYNRLSKAQCNSEPLNPGHHGHGEDINKIDSTRFNTTNLHVHGFHVSPEGHSDNVFVEINPGCYFQNRYEVPEDHAPGTFWYHGHVHGSTAIQVASGMAGAIIIEGGLDELPAIKAMEEKIFVMQQMPFLRKKSSEQYHIPFNKKTFGPSAWKDSAEARGWRTTINGQVIPVLTMAPNEVQRWRFIHAGVRETVNLSVFDKEGGKDRVFRPVAQKLHAIAEDGIAYGYREAVTNKLLQPGYRADFLFQAPDKTGDTLYVMDAASDVLGSLDSIRISESPKLLAMIVLAKRRGEIAAQLPSQKSLKGLAPYSSLEDVAPTVAKETMLFNIKPNGANTKYTIDGKPFDPKNIRKLQLGGVQDWKLSSGLADHPFHIHVNHFQLLGIIKNGVLKKFDKPIWKDTYFVKRGEVTLMRTVYKNFTGKFVIHCHILDHEDQGMMQSVEILEKLPRTSKVSFYTEGITVCGPEEKLVKVVPPD